MATYPQGVTDFIPDYQPYQPDFNFTANILQLKQSQYDQNWGKLNNIYGQLLNSSLTHNDSIKKRDNTFKRIDFDLKRVTGMDLSLEQNVQQATQLFRPFYEDNSLMKDMVWTKNTGFEKGLGEGKRYASDSKTNDEYWAGGIRAIDYKIQEFKALAYDQLPGFGDVKYTPYVNVEKAAAKIADELKIDVKRTTPQGDWIITEKNGQQALAPLQATFYAMLGKDPKVQEMYATQAYLERKDTVARDKDKPEYGGNAELAEKAYLNRTLNAMKTQTSYNAKNLLSEQNVNNRMISKLEKSIADGTDIQTTQNSLDRYKEANIQISEMLAQNENDLKMLDGNINKTLTTKGGSKLSTDNLEELRSRVDAVTGSNLLQTDLNEAALKWAQLHGEVSYDPNPFAVQRQKYQYDSSLISQRANAQKDVAYFKYKLDTDKMGYQADIDIYKMEEKVKLDSGIYEKDTKTGKLALKPELVEVQSLAKMMAKTNNTDPVKITKTINELYKGDAESAKSAIANILGALNDDGTLSNSELLSILQDDDFAGFNMKPMMKWLKENGKKSKDTKLDPKMRNMLAEEGVYTTNVEKEMMFEGTAGGDEAKAKLGAVARGSLNDVAPESITRITKRMVNVLGKKMDDPRIRNNSSVADLISYSHSLDDYAGFRQAELKNKLKHAQEISNKLKADGFMYGNQMFDDELNFVDQKGFLANVARDYPDELELSNSMTWGGYMASIALSGTAGGLIASVPTLGLGAAPGFLIGAAGAAVTYPIAGLVDIASDYLFGEKGDKNKLKRGNTNSYGSQYSANNEFEAMRERYETMVNDSELTTEITGLHHGLGEKELSNFDKFQNFTGFSEKGTGQYTAAGAGITIEPGVFSPTYQHYLEISKAVRKLDTQVTDGSTYISFNGVNQTFDDYDTDDIKNNNNIWNSIWSDLNPRTNKKGAGLGRFMVGASPIAGEDASKAAIQFMLPEEYLKKFKKDAQGNGTIDTDTYNDMLLNGITIITDANKLANISLLKNAYKSPEQVRIEKAGSDGVTYEDPRFPDYSVNYAVNPLNPAAFKVTTTFLQYDPQTRQMVKETETNNLANMGSNLVNHRRTFFNEWAVNQQQAVNNQRRQYERK